MAFWRFLTWLFVIFALLFETRAAYGLAAVALVLFYLFPHLQRRAVQNLVVERPEGVQRLFSGDEAVLRLIVRNDSSLPLAWVSGVENLPVGLGGRVHKWVVSLSPREQALIECPIYGRTRGIYDVGPIQVLGGDLFGLATYKKQAELYQTVVVYPARLSLADLNLPSNLSLGSIRAQQNIHPDPSRLAGVRPYRPGDPLRSVHWKATGRVGSLQVKQFEHTVNLNVMICVNLDEPDYDVHSFFVQQELAIDTAAAVAGYLDQKREAVGLAAVALHRKWRAGSAGQGDVFQEELGTLHIPPGQGQLMEILTALAGAACQPERAYLGLVDQVGRSLSSGSVLVLIVPRDTPEIVEEAFALARLGMYLTIIVVGGTVEHKSLLGNERGSVKIFHAVRDDSRLWMNQAVSR